MIHVSYLSKEELNTLREDIAQFKQKNNTDYLVLFEYSDDDKEYTLSCDIERTDNGFNIYISEDANFPVTEGEPLLCEEDVDVVITILSSLINGSLKKLLEEDYGR